MKSLKAECKLNKNHLIRLKISIKNTYEILMQTGRYILITYLLKINNIIHYSFEELYIPSAIVGHRYSLSIVTK